jgi:hypothetical protein
MYQAGEHLPDVLAKGISNLGKAWIQAGRTIPGRSIHGICVEARPTVQLERCQSITYSDLENKLFCGDNLSRMLSVGE